MPHKALSATKNAQLAREEHNHLMARAVLQYEEEQAKPGPGRKPGLRRICKELKQEYYIKNKKVITLNHNTLQSLVNGGRMKSEINAEKELVAEGGGKGGD